MTKSRCIVCKKKLKLIQEIKGKCKCEKVYCSEHALQHACTFDYKTIQKQKLIQENPLIIADKVTHI